MNVNSKYTEQENLKSSKVKIQREHRLFNFFIVIAVVVVVGFILSGNNKNVNDIDIIKDVFFLNYDQLKVNGLFNPNNSFEYQYYFFIYIPILLIVGSILSAKSAAEREVWLAIIGVL